MMRNGIFAKFPLDTMVYYFQMKTQNFYKYDVIGGQKSVQNIGMEIPDGCGTIAID